ncbi:MAG: hypothetical protein EHM56_08005 [Chloroflexi bacterium]|nr:MAG: hypothetical protein EHM56_08005 [Chloroflexota bacterium]
MSDVVNLTDICDAIETTLAAATGLARSESYDELSEGMQDTPALQVYPESGSQDAATSTDRSTFRAGLQQEEAVIHADLYARQRSHIGEDMSSLVTMIDAMRAVLKAQKTGDAFGLANKGIKACTWSWQRVTFTYGDPGVHYIGARFTIRLRMF